MKRMILVAFVCLLFVSLVQGVVTKPKPMKPVLELGEQATQDLIFSTYQPAQPVQECENLYETRNDYCSGIFHQYEQCVPQDMNTNVWQKRSEDCSLIGEGWVCAGGACTNKPPPVNWMPPILVGVVVLLIGGVLYLRRR